MPELPEVETTCRGLASALIGRRIESVTARRPDLRFPLPKNFAARLNGRTVEHISRRAKFILVELDDEQVLIAHLGMSGSFKIVAADDDTNPISKHDHISLVVGNGGEVRFHDPRRFGFMDLTEKSALQDHPMLRDLGPEPLGDAFTVDQFEAAIKEKRGPIKSVLLDQHVVAGLGNIYVCEALYWAGISPRRQARTVAGKRAERLVPAIRQVLREAIDAGGSSLRDFQHTDGQLGYFQKQFAVYGRENEACPNCAGSGQADQCAIKRITQSGRSTFYCSRRQR